MLPQYTLRTNITGTTTENPEIHIIDTTTDYACHNLATI